VPQSGLARPLPDIPVGHVVVPVRTTPPSASATAARTWTTPCTTTATSGLRTAGSSPSASTRSGTSTPLRWRARHPRY